MEENSFLADHGLKNRFELPGRALPARIQRLLTKGASKRNHHAELCRRPLGQANTRDYGRAKQLCGLTIRLMPIEESSRRWLILRPASHR
jgi:hypothetical protein